MDWLRFDPDPEAGVLRVEILVSRLIELQPATLEETDEFCQEIYPILDKITQMCVTHNLKQVCTANLDDVDMTKINPVTMIRIIWNVHDHTKTCILLQKCEVHGGGAFFNTLVEAVRGFLPGFMRNMIELKL